MGAPGVVKITREALLLYSDGNDFTKCMAQSTLELCSPLEGLIGVSASTEVKAKSFTHALHAHSGDLIVLSLSG